MLWDMFLQFQRYSSSLNVREYVTCPVCEAVMSSLDAQTHVNSHFEENENQNEINGGQKRRSSFGETEFFLDSKKAKFEGTNFLTFAFILFATSFFCLRTL